jgi:MYXO-CTERM domain-containing protein
MRQGTRTVLSMQNNYQGPPENFAMVVPVPVVLQKENVKTLPMAMFDKVDKLASPRLVEYWEQDPCAPPAPPAAPRRSTRYRTLPLEDAKGGAAEDLGVTVEAQFTVGEYEVVILSARDSSGLNTWLKQEKYKIPDGSEPLLRPYVQGGSKFFVAKVDSKKVRFENGMAQLSPLRFHYDSETFALPVRLGLVNSGGTQDLIVHILARGQRYETANYPNVAIPTNLDVKDGVRKDFGAFYAALFDRTLSRQPKAVVTEYAWDASTCDPCPGPTLDGNDLMTLGWDALNVAEVATSSGPPNALPMRRPPIRWRGGSGFVLTRLHLRYGKDGLGEDLVFRVAPPIVGGREFVRDGNALETGAVQSEVNNFQARYAIRHAWEGAVTCASPRRGIWGGPPSGVAAKGIEAAQKLAFAKRGGFDLVSFVAKDDNETKIDSGPLVPAPAMYAAAPDTTPAPNSSAALPPDKGVSGPPSTPPQGGCAGCRVGEGDEQSAPLGFALATAIAFALARRRR